MLTVKHVIWNGDFQTLYQAKEVRFKYRDRLNAADELPVPEFLAFDLPNGDVRMLKFGKVYVMNDAGRTVGNYDLGEAPPPAPAP